MAVPGGAMRNEGSAGPADSGGQPSATGGQPSATGGQPSATGGQPSATGGQPSATGGQPSATGGQPSATGGSGLGIERWVVAFFTAALTAAIVAPAAGRLGVWASVLVALACLAAFPVIARRLPRALQGGFGRHRVLSVLWFLLALAAVGQLGRVSAFMADPSRLWGAPFPDPNLAKHQCAAAYVHAADLSRRAEPNLYEEKFYPAFQTKEGQPPPSGVESPVAHLGASVEDPYEYPPQFLLLPRMALALTNDYLVIRTAWFVIQALALLAAAALVATWIGGREGLLAMLLVPALMASLPTLLNFQFGQFHSMTVILALLAMIAFEEKQPIAGGALLGWALVSKLFPGLLLIYLAARGRWREIGWTLGFALGFTLLALAVLGWAPYGAFLSYHLPRIASGEAFSFVDRQGVFYTARNLGIFGLIGKLGLLGLPGMTRGVASIVSWLYTAVLLALAWRAGRQERSHLAAAQLWLALLNLGALRSPLAPSAYTTVQTLWLLALLAPEIRGRIALGIGVFLAWNLIMGLPPLPPTGELVVGLVTQLLVLGINVWVVLRRPAAPALSAQAARPSAIGPQPAAA